MPPYDIEISIEQACTDVCFRQCIKGGLMRKSHLRSLLSGKRNIPQALGIRRFVTNKFPQGMREFVQRNACNKNGLAKVIYHSFGDHCSKTKESFVHVPPSPMPPMTTVAVGSVPYPPSQFAAMFARVRLPAGARCPRPGVR